MSKYSTKQKLNISESFVDGIKKKKKKVIVNIRRKIIPNRWKIWVRIA